MAIVSHPLVQHELASGRLIAPFGFVATGNSYCLLHPRKAPGTAKIAAFKSWVMSEAQAEIRPARSMSVAGRAQQGRQLRFCDGRF